MTVNLGVVDTCRVNSLVGPERKKRAFIAQDQKEASTTASFWRLLFTPMGPGHCLFLKSELTGGKWKIYSDNLAACRWLQRGIQAQLTKVNATCRKTSPRFSKVPPDRNFWKLDT